MGQYDGANRYTKQLTIKENLFCEYVVMEGLSVSDAFKKAYPEANTFSPIVLGSKVQKLTQKEKINKRFAELQIVKDAQNQTRQELVFTFEKQPKQYMLYQFLDFVSRCKQENDKSNELKGLEAIAKLYNLYGENNQQINTQLNQIIINSKDVKSAVNSIHDLINKQ